MRVDRLNEMERYILENETVSLEELTHVFSVSINTVRRDIQQLLQRGLIKKVYGGVSVSFQAEPLPMAVRAAKNSEAKQQIGALAATLIPSHTSVFLDSGSTTPQILPYLAEKAGITIVTHSLPALYEASRYPNLNVINPGGIYNAATASYVGISTVDAISNIHVQTVLIAATGVSIENGLTNSTYLEADIKRCIAANSSNIILMADHTKFDGSAALSFCPLNKLSAIVTDQKPSKAYLAFMDKHNIRLLCPRKFK